VSEFKKIDFGLKVRDEMIIQLNQSIARLNQKEKPEGSNQQGDKKKKIRLHHIYAGVCTSIKKLIHLLLLRFTGEDKFFTC
jgi:hypothetical protein